MPSIQTQLPIHANETQIIIDPEGAHVEEIMVIRKVDGTAGSPISFACCNSSYPRSLPTSPISISAYRGLTS